MSWVCRCVSFKSEVRSSFLWSEYVSNSLRDYRHLKKKLSVCEILTTDGWTDRQTVLYFSLITALTEQHFIDVIIWTFEILKSQCIFWASLSYNNVCSKVCLEQNSSHSNLLSGSASLTANYRCYSGFAMIQKPALTVTGTGNDTGTNCMWGGCVKS